MGALSTAGLSVGAAGIASRAAERVGVGVELVERRDEKFQRAQENPS
jgi:hypothetical protein